MTQRLTAQAAKPVRQSFTRVLAVMALILLSLSANAASVLRLNDHQDSRQLGPVLQYAEDAHAEFSAVEIQQGKARLQWQNHDGKVLSLGYSSSAWWIRVNIDNPGPARKRWLVIGYPLLNDVTVYQIRNNLITRKMIGGTLRPAPDDVIRSHQLLFPLEFDTNGKETLLLRVKSGTSLLLPMSLEKTAPLINDGSRHLSWMGLFFGFLGGLLLYHLIVLINFRDRSYGLLLAAITGLMVAVALLGGIVDRYLVTQENYLSGKLIPVAIMATGCLIVMLTRSFLDTRHLFPRADRWLFVGACIMGFCTVLAMIADYHTGILVALPTFPAIIISGLAISVLSRQKGYRPAGLLLIGWLLLAGGTATYALRAAGVVPENGLTDRSLMLSLMAFVLFVACALTDRLRLLAEDSRNATEALALHTQRQNAALEAEVEARTCELADETAQLTSARHTLLFQSRRLASGVMSAGIAHEINNPNNFISVGVQTFQNRLDGFVRMLDEVLDDSAPPDIRQELEARIARLRSSAFRIAENSAEISLIVQRFRNVSNGDESDVLITDVVTRIENAILTTRSSLADKVSIRTDFSVRHEVKCRPMESAHTFMDIMGNVALKAHHHGEMRIDSKIQSGRLMISLRTNYPFRVNDEMLSRCEAIMTTQRGELKIPNDRTLVFLFPLR
jgi:signal transduction histidine kinase